MSFAFEVMLLEGQKRVGGRVYKKDKRGNKVTTADLGGIVLTEFQLLHGSRFELVSLKSYVMIQRFASRCQGRHIGQQMGARHEGSDTSRIRARIMNLIAKDKEISLEG
uniref:Uncharacterized protein n=1 Tax=Solanum tuberosum TaxID=4113 RepID=M1E0T3_SOLTU